MRHQSRTKDQAMIARQPDGVGTIDLNSAGLKAARCEPIGCRSDPWNFGILGRRYFSTKSFDARGGWPVHYGGGGREDPRAVSSSIVRRSDALCPAFAVREKQSPPAAGLWPGAHGHARFHTEDIRPIPRRMCLAGFRTMGTTCWPFAAKLISSAALY